MLKRLPRISLLALGLGLSACGSAPDQSSSEPAVATIREALRFAPERAFTWAHLDALPQAGVYVPDPVYSFNGGGGGIIVSVNPATPGQYRVAFGGFTSNAGNAQVVAYGDDNKRCKVLGWSTTAGTLLVNVQCHDAAGRPANSRFLVNYTNDFKNQPGSIAGFMWADQPTVSHTPSSGFSFNSVGGANFVHYFGTGAYVAEFKGLNTDRGNAQVTAYGTDDTYCKMNGWVSSQNSTLVGVLCFDAKGAAKDSRFSLQFVGQQAPNEVWNRSYVWAERLDQAINTPYTPSAVHNFNQLVQSNTANTAKRTALGSYVVTHSELMNAPSAAMITAVGNDAAYCKPARWSNNAGSTDMQVNCFNSAGNVVNSTFSAMYIQQESECVTPPCATFQHLVHPRRIQTEDNPRLRGYAHWPGTFSVTGQQQDYFGSFVPAVSTNPPSIIGSFGSSSFVPSVANAVASTLTPRLVTRAPPWIEFPCASSNGCARSGVLPYWSPGISLPRNHATVRVTMQNVNPPAFSDENVHSFNIKLDDNVLIVPVHVHVLRNNGGGAPASYSPNFRLGTDGEIAAKIRQNFDQSVVQNGSTTIFQTPEAVSAAPMKLFDPLLKRTRTEGSVEVPVFGDDIFGQCGVQLRLESVSYLRQNMGLETALLNDTNEVPSGCRDLGFCSTSRAGRLGNELVNAFNAAGLPGIHVIVGGEIWPGIQFCGGLVKGLSCQSVARFVLIDGSTSIRNPFRMQTVFHEIGHVLTSSSGHAPDTNNLMHERSNGGLLTQEQCSEIRIRAAAF